jgi:hypothetical protein
MKAIAIGNKTYLVRHWFRWYKVGKSGLEWVSLPPIIKNGKPLPKDAIAAAAKSLPKATPISLLDLDK